MTKKKKPQRPRQPERYCFTNCDGKRVWMDADMTLAEAVAKFDVRKIILTPKEDPPSKDKRIYTHVPK